MGSGELRRASREYRTKYFAPSETDKLGMVKTVVLKEIEKPK